MVRAPERPLLGDPTQFPDPVHQRHTCGGLYGDVVRSMSLSDKVAVPALWGYTRSLAERDFRSLYLRLCQPRFPQL